MNKQIIKQIKEIKGVKTVEPMDNRVVVTFEAERVAVYCTNAEQFNFANNKIARKSNCIFGNDRENYEQADTVSLFTGGVSNRDFYRERGHSIITFTQYLTDYNLTDEWEKYLLGEAEKRGFVNGVSFKGVEGADKNELITIGEKYGVSYRDVGKSEGLHCGNSWILYDGKWADIIPNEIELVDGEIYFDKDKIMLSRNIFRYKCKGEVHSVLFTSDNEFDSQTTMELSNNIKQATTKQKKKLIKAEVKNGYFHELNK